MICSALEQAAATMAGFSVVRLVRFCFPLVEGQLRKATLIHFLSRFCRLERSTSPNFTGHGSCY